MNDAPIITSLLEQDFYKFTMGQLVLHQLPTVNVRVEFRLRRSLYGLCHGNVRIVCIDRHRERLHFALR